jgi:hypothetical protein
MDYSLIRIKLCNYLMSSAHLKIYTDFLKDKLVTPLTELTRIIESESVASTVLFPPEKANPRREVLKELILITPSRGVIKDSDFIDMLGLDLKQAWKMITNLKDLEWWSGKPLIFEEIAKVILRIQLTSANGTNEFEKDVKMHPILMEMMTDYKKVSSRFIE